MILALRTMLSTLISGDRRSRLIAVNIGKSFIVKILGTLITLALVPLSLNHIEKESYGVWLTIASVITWFGVFDMGLSNGLTNRLTETFAKNDNQMARIYLSTTYFILLLITGGMSLIYFLITPFIDWNLVFRTTMRQDILSQTVNLTFCSFVLLFILKPLTSLLMAKQKHFLSNLIQVLGNLVALLLIHFMEKQVINERFIFFSTALAFSYPLMLLLFSIILYQFTYKEFLPSPQAIDLRYSRDLFGLSIKFFIIQICVIVVLTGNNFLIAHFIDSSTVTYYNIAYRLYSIASIFQLMFLQPLWSGFTHAYTLKDFAWIRKVITKINMLNFALCWVLLLMFLLHDVIYQLWVGPNISIPYEIDLLLFVYFIFYVFMQTYVHFINGVGRLNLQTLLSAATFILQVPLAYLLVIRAGLGISGLLILNIFWVVVSLILWRLQYRKIMSGLVLSRIWH